MAAVKDGQHVAFSVADDGAGVAPELLAHLFDKHAGGGSGTAGDGLGLAICKGLVEAHGGRIRAASDGPGRSTTVTFTVPAVESSAAEARSAGGAAAPGPRDRARVLAVDDDPNTLRFVRDALEKAGYAPLVTGAPDDLAGLIRAERPALVVLDLMLPGRDGLRLLEEIPELSDLPVIFISGYGRDETIARAFELGADDYVVKPFSDAEEAGVGRDGADEVEGRGHGLEVVDGGPARGDDEVGGLGGRDRALLDARRGVHHGEIDALPRRRVEHLGEARRLGGVRTGAAPGNGRAPGWSWRRSGRAGGVGVRRKRLDKDRRRHAVEVYRSR